MPPIGSFALSEALVALLGVIIFGFFGAKKDVLDFWRQLFGGNLSRVVETQSSIEMANRSHHSTEKEKKDRESKAATAGAAEDDV